MVSFLIVPPIQALRGLPCLGSFSVIWCLKHIEGLPWLGSYSVAGASGTERGTLGGVLLCSSVSGCLVGQALYCSAADAGMWGERGYGDGSTPYT